MNLMRLRKKNQNKRTSNRKLRNISGRSYSFSQYPDFASDLMNAWLDNRAYSKQMDCELIKMKEKLKLPKIDYFITIKIITQELD